LERTSSTMLFVRTVGGTTEATGVSRGCSKEPRSIGGFVDMSEDMGVLLGSCDRRGIEVAPTSPRAVSNPPKSPASVLVLISTALDGEIFKDVKEVRPLDPTPNTDNNPGISP
jgi:hypothetical protein